MMKLKSNRKLSQRMLKTKNLSFSLLLGIELELGRATISLQTLMMKVTLSQSN
jgi:hypothetical protein